MNYFFSGFLPCVFSVVLELPFFKYWASWTGSLSFHLVFCIFFTFSILSGLFFNNRGLLQLSDSLQPHGLYPGVLLCPWNSPVKNIRVGCHFLPQRIFWTQGQNPYLLHWQADSLPLSHLGSPYTYMCIHTHTHTHTHTNTYINLSIFYNNIKPSS